MFISDIIHRCLELELAETEINITLTKIVIKSHMCQYPISTSGIVNFD